MSSTTTVQQISIHGVNEFADPVDDPIQGYRLPAHNLSSFQGRTLVMKLQTDVPSAPMAELKKFPEEMDDMDKLKKFPEEVEKETKKGKTLEEEPVVEKTKEVEPVKEVVKEEMIKEVIEEEVAVEEPVVEEPVVKEPVKVVVPVEEEPPTTAPETITPPPAPIVIKKKVYPSGDVKSVSDIFKDYCVRNMYTPPTPATSTIPLDQIGTALRNISSFNERMMDTIVARLNSRVISGYTYSIDGVLPDWKVKATPVRNLARSCYHAWEYKGDGLNQTMDVFHDNLDYTLKKATDVRRLNTAVCFVGCKVADFLPDRDRVRNILMCYVANMKLLQSMVLEIDVITKDLPEELCPKLEKDMEATKAVFEKMQETLSKIKLAVNVTQYEGFEGILSDHVLFESPASISKRAELKAHSNVVSEIVHYELDGKPCLASASRDHTICLWDLGTHKVQCTLEGHEGVVNALQLLDIDGRPHLASASFDKTIMIWDLTNKTRIATFAAHTHYVYSLAHYKNQNIPYLASGGCDGTVNIWNLKKMAKCYTLKLPSTASHVFALATFAVNGTPYLAVGTNDDNVRIFDLTSSSTEPVAILPNAHKTPINAIVSYDCDSQTYLATTAQDDGIIKLWNVEIPTKPTYVASLGHAPEGCSEIALTTFGVFLNEEIPALGSGDERGVLKFWNLKTHTLVKVMDKKEDCGPVRSLAVFNHERRPHLAIGSNSNVGSIDLLSE